MPETLQVEMVDIVNRYFTPFAILLVAIGVLVSQPAVWVTRTALAFLLFTVLFNFGTAALVRKEGRLTAGLALARQITNLAVNVVIVYLLGGYWTPAWLLFVLTPAATALYGNRRRTWFTAVGVAFLRLATHGLLRLNAPIDWGRAFVESMFIVFLSLFLHELAGRIRAADAKGH